LRTDRQEHDSKPVGTGTAAGWSFAHIPIHWAIQDGVERLPHLARIQSSFGHHDVNNVRAYLGREASEANRRLDAEAFTSGERVAFAGFPSVQTAAHEAAHVIQQRKGVYLQNDIGQAGDLYEKHADAVAELVVMGKPAGPFLDRLAGMGNALTAREVPPIQMQPKAKPPAPQMPEIPGLLESFAKWAAIDQIKEPIVRALTKEYVTFARGFETADVFFEWTPVGANKVKHGIHAPAEERVFQTLMSVIDLKKIGKGDKDWSFRWADEKAPQKKTADEQLTEIAMFGVNQRVDQLGEKLKNPTLGLAFEYASTGKVAPVSIVKTISEPVAEWVMKDVLLLSAEVVGRTLPVIGWLWLAYDIAELATSLKEPSEQELSQYQEESANIVAAVKGYLEGKKETARRAEERKQPFNPNPNITLQKDKAAVARRGPLW
jgi:hypothetical protein